MVQGLKLALAPLLWRFLSATISREPLPDRYLDPDQPLIYSCLHRDILAAIMHVKPARPTLLVSQSPDGNILVRTLGHRNYRFVRGATGEDGGSAFRGLVRAIEEGSSVGVAVDGPKGPYGVIQDGVVQLSRLTGAPILPLVARCSRAKVLSTWDRTVVPYPFSRVVFDHGPLLTIDRQAGHEDLKRVKHLLAGFFEGGGAAS